MYLNCLFVWLLNGQSTASDAPSLISSRQCVDKSAGHHSQGYQLEGLYFKPANDRVSAPCEPRHTANALPLEMASLPFGQWTQRRNGFQVNGFSEFKISVPDFKQLIVDSHHSDYADISSIVIVGESLVEAKGNVTPPEEQTTALEAKSGNQSDPSITHERHFTEGSSKVTLELRIRSSEVACQSKKPPLQARLDQSTEIHSSRNSSTTIGEKNLVADGQLSSILYSSDQRLRDSKASVGKEPTFHAIPAKDQQLRSDFRSANWDEVHDRINERGELLFGSNPDLSYRTYARRIERLKSTIEGALKFYHNKPEEASIRTHWGMMHQIMIFGSDTHILDRKRKYNAISWMAGNNQCRNQLLFGIDNGGLFVKSGVGLQGHQGQFLAILGQIDVPLEYPIYVGRNKFSVEDILRREMLDCKVESELTFVLIGVSHYKDSDSSWNARDGQHWNVEKLIAEELRQPIVGAACGGTHRLMGLGHSLRRRRAERKSVSGEWQRAEKFVTDFIQYTWSLQNRDGSMSTAWFERPQDNGSIDRKVQTTGHILEMLMVVSSDEELYSPRMLSAVEFLADAMFEERHNDWEVGPKGHALRSLVMFYHRAFGDPSPWRLNGEIRNSRGTNFSAGDNRVR